MGCIHDTGYSPAYEHEGYTASVLICGADATDTSSQIEPNVIGWRAACECGWRGMQFYPRAEWPSATGGPPDQVDGWTNGDGADGEWEAHLRRALPELAVPRPITRRHDAAVHSARTVGLSWSVIGRAAGVTAGEAPDRWAGAAPDLSSRRSDRSILRSGDEPSR